MTSTKESTRGPNITAKPSLRFLALGLLLLQGVWILAVPPFRASDEFDHVYRAAAVARGEWVAAPTNATRGAGAFVVVPDDIVAAARAECARLPYTDASDCVGTPKPGGTQVATGAGRYHPLFYAVIGIPALPLEGAAALYTMRLVAALCCWTTMLAAFIAVRTWSSTSWPAISLLVCCSPVVIFSSAMAAPNGLEMTSAAALWSALTGLLQSPLSPHRNRLLLIGAVSACLLVSLRSLGPLWACLIFAVLMVVEPGRWNDLRLLLRSPIVWISSLAVVSAAISSLAWIVTNEPMARAASEPVVLTATETIEAYWKTMVTWVFQSIGAFPYRNAPAPPITYICYLFLVVALVGFAIRTANRRERWVLATTMLLSLLIPLAITALTFEAQGIAWQGRYTIPFSMGFIFVAGLVLDRRDVEMPRIVVLAGALLFTVAQAFSPAWLAAGERHDSPGVGNGDWLLVAPPILGAAAAVACAAMWFGATRKQSLVSGPT